LRLICGFVRLDGAPADPDILQSIIRALGSPGLTHTVQKTVDGCAALAVLEFGDEPALPPTLPHDPAGVWLAGDLRLDRPLELAATLGLPRNASPAELALAAYSRWGIDLPDHLDGDFALAAWNPRQRRLVCARDIMGVRPLCYASRAGEWFAFASLPRGLHGSGVVTPRPNLAALGHMLINVFPGDTDSAYAGISWLPAGHSLVVQGGDIRRERAWRPDEFEVGTWRGSPGEAAETLRGLLTDAVACRLPQSGPVAAHLSGGLDSSAITILAARLLSEKGRQLLAYSQLAGDDGEADLLDERGFVESVLAQEPGIRWSAFHAPPFGPSVEAVDVDLPGTLATFAAAKHSSSAAAADGARILLAGAGGDEAATYNATSLHAALLRQGHWDCLPGEIRKLATRTRRSAVRVGLERLVAPLLPEWVFTLARHLRGRPSGYRRSIELSLLTPEVAREVAVSRPRPAFNVRSTPAERIRSLTHGYLAARATSWAIQGARDAVAFSFPLQDRRVLDFMLSLPLNQLVGHGFTRQPFRNAMAGILPEDIRWRDTKFFSVPQAPLTFAAAKPELRAHVAAIRKSPLATAFVNADALEQAIERIVEGDAARDLASKVNRDHAASTDTRRAQAAIRALQMAQHVARFE
jgi:asparagine synthase (glutamine-hydrolysing)